MSMGGKYHRKNNTKAKDKKSFMKLIEQLGYSKKAALNTWNKEEKKARKIGVVKGHYLPAKTPIKRRTNARSKWMGKAMREGMSMKEASEAYKKFVNSK
jgi:hypothetical protein